MTIRRHLTVILLAVALLGSAVACQCGWLIPWPPTDPLCAEAPFMPPDAETAESDLVGTWESRYGRSVDTLLIRPDGTFKQVYQDGYASGYVYETPWSEWWLERFPHGRLRVHLQGARYYIDGISIGERDGYTYLGPKRDPDTSSEPEGLPWLFYDPFSGDHFEMVRELVLTIRVDSSGELLLHHMSYTSDEGFSLSGCQRRHFRRVEGP